MAKTKDLPTEVLHLKTTFDDLRCMAGEPTNPSTTKSQTSIETTLLYENSYIRLEIMKTLCPSLSNTILKLSSEEINNAIFLFKTIQSVLLKTKISHSSRRKEKNL